MLALPSPKHHTPNASDHGRLTARMMKKKAPMVAMKAIWLWPQHDCSCQSAIADDSASASSLSSALLSRHAPDETRNKNFKKSINHWRCQKMAHTNVRFEENVERSKQVGLGLSCCGDVFFLCVWDHQWRERESERASEGWPGRARDQRRTWNGACGERSRESSGRRGSGEPSRRAGSGPPCSHCALRPARDGLPGGRTGRPCAFDIERA